MAINKKKRPGRTVKTIWIEPSGDTRKTISISKDKYLWPYLLVAPALITICCIVLIPAVKALVMSLQNYDLRYSPKDIHFIGLENYRTVLSDSFFWDSVWRTLLMVILCVSLQFLLGFALAMLLNRSFRGRGVLRATSMIPWVVPGVLVGLIWRWMYDGNYGVINDILVKLGIFKQYYGFLAQPDSALLSVIFTYVWQGIPFFTLMILAALQSVPHELYEAAAIDGASAAQKLTRVTIPSIKNSITVSLMLRIIWVASLPTKCERKQRHLLAGHVASFFGQRSGKDRLATHIRADPAACGHLCTKLRRELFHAAQRAVY